MFRRLIQARIVPAVLAFGAVLFVLRGPARADVLAFFDFNDASDPAVALDISGNENHGDIFFAEYTELGEGRAGGADDRAMDFGDAGDGALIEVPSVLDGALQSLVDNDAATLTMWVFGGDQQPANGVNFYIGSDGAEVDGDPRELLAHIPWSNANIYFDVAGCCGSNQRVFRNEPDDSLYRDQWNHYAFVKDGEYTAIYQNGELFADSDSSDADPGPKDPLRVINGFAIGADLGGGNSYNGLMDDFGLWDEALSVEQINNVMENGYGDSGGPLMQAGDANMDLEFNQLDLVQVQIAAKYLSGQAATWGDGDWDGAPGGAPGSPPPGDGKFDQIDIIAALNAGKYLTGPYAAIDPDGVIGDGQTSVTYNVSTGEVGVDAPAGVELTSINIDSAAGIFTGDAAANLGGSFDNDADDNIFKATFGSSFGSLSFGNVAQPGLSAEFVANDLTVVGSLDGGGALGDVDLVYVPEPSAIALLGIGMAGAILIHRRRRA